jgi:lipopolysaccharide/colanic/teichoic acid biosynthesis glycosyltransferase
MLLDSSNLLNEEVRTGPPERILRGLSLATRETDIKGWYRDGTVIGVIFTEIALTETSVVEILTDKVRYSLHAALGAQQADEIDLSFYVFPDVSEDNDGGIPAAEQFKSRRIPFLIKRCLDVVGSILALFVLLPLIMLIAAAIKLTSPGPVLFRQARLGQFGKSFSFLKFRSMYTKTDHAVHEAYIRSFISNQAESPTGAGTGKIYKMQGDPRITRVGRFLRRTSLDEIPQFFNVLVGHMSLVGPRPPLPYEFAAYEIWHRRRLLAVKPGITGFWQVDGRSRVKFDEMVRMDIEYATRWSLWMDIKILLRTPRAVVSGNGAC